MSLVFYYAPMSSATPVHWSLEELAIPYEKVRIDLQAGGQKKPEYLKLNPNGQVPLIVHDGVPIFESAAIQIYLGETFGVEKGLFPAPGTQRGLAIQWIVWCNVTVGDAGSRYFRNTSDRIPADQRNEKAGEVAKADLADRLKILDSALQGRSYLVGDTFSLADVHLASWMDYMQMFAVDLKSYAAISAWCDRCRTRPAHARAMSPES